MSAGSHVALAHPVMVDEKVHAFVTVFREPAAECYGAVGDAVLVTRRKGRALVGDDIWLLPDEAEEMAAKLLMAAAEVRARLVRLADRDARSSA